MTSRMQYQKTIHVLSTGLVSKNFLSGGDQLFLDIAPRIQKNIKIIVIAPHFMTGEFYWGKKTNSNIELRLLPKNIFDLNLNPINVFLSYVIRAIQTYKILKNEDVQTMYSCSDIAYADIWPAYLIARKNKDIKWLSRVYHILLNPKNRQGSGPVNFIAYHLQRLSFLLMKKQSSTVFALNEKLKKELINLGFPYYKVDTLGAGIDFRKINSHKSKNKYNYNIVAMGRVAPVKGIYDMVEAWRLVHSKNPNLKFAWIGYGADKYTQKMKNMIIDYGLQDSFSLLGFLDKEDAYDILQSADVFVCSDHEIGWGLAVCEAMASELPVVSYDLDVFGSVYSKGYLSSKIFNTQGLAENILNLVSDNKLRKKLSEEAVLQASEFDHESVLNKLVKFI